MKKRKRKNKNYLLSQNLNKKKMLKRKLLKNKVLVMHPIIQDKTKNGMLMNTLN